MDPFEMIVAVVGMACTTGLAGAAIWGWVEVAKAKALRGAGHLSNELQALRQELRQLREQNADLMLHYDTAIQQLAAGAGTAERRLATGGEAAVRTGAPPE
jgi:hypothetical protein